MTFALLPGVVCYRCGQLHVALWHGRVVGACELTQQNRRDIAAEREDEANHRARETAVIAP